MAKKTGRLRSVAAGAAGMPPFGDGHDDRTIWNIAGFVERLPAMTADEYRAFGGGMDHGQSGHTH